MRVAFGECTFDSESRELYRRGEAVHLEPKCFLLLQTLLENRPRVVTRAELEERLWPGFLYVSENCLARLVCELRAAVGDSAGAPRVLRTVPRVGYAFCAGARNLDLEARALSPHLFDERAIAEHFGISVRTLRGWRRAGLGPPFLRLSESPHGTIRYDPEDVRHYLAERRVMPGKGT